MTGSQLKLIIVLLIVLSSTLMSQTQQFTETFYAKIVEVEPQSADRGTKVSLHVKSEVGFDRDRLQVFFNDTIRAKIILVENARIDVIVPFILNLKSTPTIDIRRVGSNKNLDTYRKFRVGANKLEIINVIPGEAKAGQEIKLELSYEIDTSADLKILFTVLTDSIMVLSPQTIEPKLISVIVPDLPKAGSQDIRIKIDEFVTRSTYNFIFQKDESWFTFNLFSIITILSITIIIFLVSYILRKSYSKKEKLEAEISSIGATNEINQIDLNLPKLEPPNALIQAIESGECILFAGAGLSARAGFPTWKTFIEGLLQWGIEKAYLDKYYSQSLYSAIETNELNVVADSIVSKVKSKQGEKELIKYLRTVFNRQGAYIPTSHHLLTEINFSGVITPNYDDLLSRIYIGHSEVQIAQQIRIKNTESIGTEFVSQDTQELLNAYSKKDFFLFYLYGSLNRPESVIVSPADYKDMLANNRSLLQFMENVFYSKTLFFIGTSLQGIEDYLSGMNLSTTKGAHRHYALVAVSDSAWQSKAEILQRRFGIIILPFQISENFPEVDNFLQKIIIALDKMQRTEIPSVSETYAQSKIKTSRLKSIKLENIGPFDSLHLKLDNQWNILLGDNGVGKSTILKAIAVGICGEEAAAYANRLIKTGKTSAKIIIETSNGKEYLTEIYNVNGKAEIKSLPAKLLESEGWLCLGFPPLRNLSWERSKAPQPVGGKGRPLSSDLLPLIKGEADPRLDKLKQWIVDLDYRIKDDKVKNITNSPFETLLNEFFKFVDDLTEGVKVEFKAVNPDTKEVIIITDDGEVPIESISQGTASLIGWIGVVMQRFYEIYGNQPRGRFGLVLIDEIDAHMHPAWQQTIVPHLIKIFPNVQFVATTHSPFIVGGMESGQLYRLMRQSGETNIQVNRVMESYKGWRIDQIVTTLLFGLKTSRDLETQKILMRYTELSGKDILTKKETEELKELAEKLKLSLPSPYETEEAREASTLIKDHFESKWKEKPQEEKALIFQEIDKQLKELYSKEGGEK